MSNHSDDLSTRHPMLWGHGMVHTESALDTLAREYESLRRCAPSRRSVGKRYFVDSHDGVTSSKGRSNRREEHCAVALVNLKREWRHPNGGSFRFLDYQFPLKARQSDHGVGKIDLVGVDNRGRFIVVELKVDNKGGRGNDSPDSALMQGLRYAAMAHKNLPAIMNEASAYFGVNVREVAPIAQLLATEAWWRRYGFQCAAASAQQRQFGALTKAIADKIGVAIECLAFDRLDVEYGLDGEPPRFNAMPQLRALPL